jgi:hypothetical protein
VSYVIKNPHRANDGRMNAAARRAPEPRGEEPPAIPLHRFSRQPVVLSVGVFKHRLVLSIGVFKH